jgi:hypothetical protein
MQEAKPTPTASTPRKVRVSGKDADPKPRVETSPDQGRPLNRAMRSLAEKQADEERAEKVNR